VIVTHYFEDQIKHRITREAKEAGWKVRFAHQSHPEGTAHALLTARDHVDADRFLVVCGDLLVEPEALQPAVEAVSKGQNVIVGVEVPDISGYGELVTSKDLLKQIVEKPPEHRPGLANTGIYALSSNIWPLLEKVSRSPRGEYELTDAITELAQKTDIYVPHIDRSYWMDIGNLWDLLEANRRVLEKMPPRVLGEVEPGVHLIGKVIIGEDTLVLPGAYIRGPVYIGRNCKIGPNCYIRPYTSIESKVRIGNAVEIKNSIILSHTNIAHLSYVGDSIIGEHCNLGAGTIIANLRHDEATIKVTVRGKRVDTGLRKFGAVFGDYVKTGVNVSIMPGVLVGHDVWIGPHLCIMRDIPPHSRILSRQPPTAV